MKHKQNKGQIKDITGKGVVTIAISKFDNRDSYDDIVRRGAFAKTFKENDRIKHVIDHRLAQSFVVGLPLKMYETTTHAVVESALNLEKEISRDLYADYKFFHENDRSLEHSYAYETIKNQENKQIRGEDITELKMYEYSTVALGANPETPLLDVKSFSDVSTLITELETRLSKCNYSEERGKLIKKAIYILSNIEEPDLSTLRKQIDEPFNNTHSIWKTIKENY